MSLEKRQMIQGAVGEMRRSTGIGARALAGFGGVPRSARQEWQGEETKHNGNAPKRHRLTPGGQEAVAGYCRERLEQGCRRLTCQMTDENIVAVSCSAVYAVLRKAGLKKKLAACAEESMKWFERPRSVHEQWHRDFSYIKRGGSFYYFAAVLDGCSRMILGWGFCLTMESLTVQAVAREAKGRYPRGNPRLATDNGSQFVSGDFKELVMLLEMRRAFIRPGHPQSNGKLERFQRTLKSEEARGSAYFDYEDARKRLAGWIETTTRFGCTARFII